MGKTRLLAPLTTPRLVPSLVGAEPDGLARESTAHAEAIRRLEDQRSTLGSNLTALELLVAEIAAFPGRFLARQVLSGSGTYIPTTGTRRVVARWVGAGGGGGGAGGGASVAAGAGGSSGVYLEALIGEDATAITGGAYSCGAGGTAGSSAGGAGGAGGDATIVINGTTWTAKGGAGGAGMVSSVDGFAAAGTPAAGSSSSTEVAFSSYGLGGYGVTFGGTRWFSGNGGDSPFGAGAIGAGSGAGINGVRGSGASGGASTAIGGAGFAGGVGGDGLIVIEEFS